MDAASWMVQHVVGAFRFIYPIPFGGHAEDMEKQMERRKRLMFSLFTIAHDKLGFLKHWFIISVIGYRC